MAVPDRSASVEEKLTYVEQNVTTSSVKDRVTMFQGILLPVIESEASVDEHLGRIAKILNATLDVYTDKGSANAVVDVIIALAKRSSKFAKSFAKFVEKLASKKGGNATRVTHVLLRWTLALIESAFPAIAEEEAAAAALITALIKIMDETRASRARATSRLAVLNTLVKVPELFPVIMKMLLAREPSLEAAELLGVLTTRTTQPPADERALLSENKANMLKIYINTMLSPKAEPTRDHVEGLGPLIKTFNHEEFGGTVLPAIGRLVKRSPGSGVEILGHLLEHTSLDMSAYVREGILDVLTAAIRSEGADLRQNAVGVLAAALKQTSDPEVAMAVEEALVGLTKGSNTNWYQRAGLYAAFGALASAEINRAAADALAQAAIGHLLDALKAEANDDAKVACLLAVGQLLARSDVLPAGLATAFAAGINTKKNLKENVRRAYLRCLYRGLHRETVTQAAGLVEPLCQVLKDAGANPKNLYSEGVMAAGIITLIASSDTALDQQFVEGGIWNLILGDGSFVLAPPPVSSKFSEDDITGHVELVERILRDHPTKIPLLGGASAGPLAVLLVSFLTHASWKVSTAACAAAKRLLNASPRFCGDLIAAWPVVLRQGNLGPATVLVDGLKASLSAEPPRDRTAEILVLAHHPALTENSRPVSRVWETLVKFHATLAETVTANAQGVIDSLMGANGLLSPDGGVSSAAVAASATLARELFEHDPQDAAALLSPIIALVDDRSLDGISARDVVVANAPEGQLAPEDDTVFRAQVVESRNKTEEERWEEETRKKLEEKKKAAPAPAAKGKGPKPTTPTAAKGKGPAAKGAPVAKGGKDAEAAKKAARDAEKLAEESALRVRVKALEARAQQGLAVLRTIAQTAPQVAHAFMNLILPVVIRLAKNPLVGRAACDVVGALAGTLSPALHPQAEQLAAAVLRIQGATVDERWTAESLPAMLSRIVTDMAQAAESAEFSGASVCYVFPILDSVLRDSSFVPDVHQGAFNVVALHSGISDTLPRSGMISVCIHVLSTMPRLEHRAQEALPQLAANMSESDLPALLDGFVSAGANVRLHALQALTQAEDVWATLDEKRDFLASRLWLLKHDTEAPVVELASAMWEEHGFTIDAGFIRRLLTLLSEPEADVRAMAGRAVAEAVGAAESDAADDSVRDLVQLYEDQFPPPPKEEDAFKFKHVLVDRSREETDSYAVAQLRTRTRHGVAQAIGASKGHLSAEQISRVFEFLIERGLSDPDASVRKAMREGGVEIVKEQGKDYMDELLPIFEAQLDAKATNERDDLVREGVIVFIGTLAQHLTEEDPKVVSIFDRLIEALRTPSAPVQLAVAQCIPKLMKSLKGQAAHYVELLMDRLLSAPAYADRKGAAYGLAGVVKGLGLSSLKQFEVMPRLQAAVQDKHSAEKREAALFAFECFSLMLERLFEPYVVHILEHLLDRYGDQNANVRESALDASKQVMGQLTAHGVKLVLPVLITKLTDRMWRTKQGAVTMLGSMAYCAPKQLSQCLPAVVPRLIDVLSDTHPKVQESGREALGQVGSVVRNPEIQSHVKVILSALNDPNCTSKALETLLNTSFVHRIDAPSLALIVPILYRGLRERSAEVKSNTARIVGNMCSLTDPKDLEPYLELLLPALKNVLTDPIPEVRSIVARALGSLVSGMGEENFSDLIPWLIESLKDGTSAVVRSGAAQGLSEVLGNLGIERFQLLLPELLKNTNHAKAVVREGFLNIFVFLPKILAQKFEPFISDVLPAILQGLADEAEFVRETAFRAGQVVVTHFGQRSLTLLLPALEKGLFNDDWRIRQSSVSLLGDLLFRISGASGNIQVNEEDSDDEGFSTEAHGRAILEVLGRERRDTILSALYMMRLDVSPIVRQASLQVWKQVVANTPRTLKEIVPVLMGMLITCLASTNPDKRQIASRTLGDLVNKLGDRVLPEIIPIFEQGLSSPDADKRQGVCLGLSEVLSTTSKVLLEDYVPAIVPAIRKALLDESEDVREAAALAYDMLYQTVGKRALEDIIPFLLKNVAAKDSERSVFALDGLRQILAVRSNVVLPYLLPKLIKPPLTDSNCRAIATLAEVAGNVLNHHLGQLLPPLMFAMASENPEVAQEASKAAETVVLCVSEEGVTAVINELLKALKSDSEPIFRQNGANLLAAFCGAKRFDITSSLNNLFRYLLVLYNDANPDVVEAAVKALNTVTEAHKPDDLLGYIAHIRTNIRAVADTTRYGEDFELPGFNTKTGLDALLPVFLHGLMYGTPELREASAQAIGECVKLTNPDALKKHVIKLTGPLIRILGDRFTWQVKAAILSTLSVLLMKGGANIKPFLPQLQTTLIKALDNSTRQVRLRAASALAILVPMQSRVDPLLTELHNGVTKSEDSIKETMLKALQNALADAGSKATPKVRDAIRPTLFELLGCDKEDVRGAAAKCLAVLARFVEPDGLPSLIGGLVTGPSGDWMPRHGRALAIAALLKLSPGVVEGHVGEFVDTVCDQLRDDKVPIRQAAVKSVGRLAMQPFGTPALPALIPPLGHLLNNDTSNDVKRTALLVLKNVAKRAPKALEPHLGVLVPGLLASARSTNIPVKLAAERGLLYALRLNTGDFSTLEAHVATLDATSGRQLNDYCRRVVAKLNTDEGSVESDSDREDNGQPGPSGE